MKDRSWTELFVVAGVVAVVCVAADLGLQQLVELPPNRIEVADGIRDYESSDPDLLVLGSSHARGFTVIRERLEAAPGGGLNTVQMAVEYGKLTSYRWVVENRLRPIIEETDESGRLRRSKLSRVLLVTEWWDGCAPATRPAKNVPGRAWTLGHFLADFVVHGLRDFNRNYLNYQWTHRMRGSILVSDRGVGRVPKALIGLVRPVSDEARQADFDARVEWWRQMVEGGFSDAACFDETELGAAEHIIDYFRGRGVEVAVVLYPRMPATITEQAKRTTLARYRQKMQAICDARGIRLIDWSTRSPLTDDDFMNDFDHTTAVGNTKLADWGLAGDLSFLLTPPPRASLEVAP